MLSGRKQGLCHKLRALSNITCEDTSARLLSGSLACSGLKTGMLFRCGSGGEAGGVERMGFNFLNLETSLSISRESSYRGGIGQSRCGW